MGLYAGAKSLDAEITLDLTKCVIQMDYSLNKIQCDKSDSNNSFFDSPNNVEYDYNPSILTRIHDSFKRLYLVIKEHFWTISITKKQPTKEEAYAYQKFLEYYQKYFYGVSEYVFEGQHNSKEIIYHLANNIWLQYDLEGDYKNKIKTIQLKRRMIKNTGKFGVYLAQDGWNLIFTFKGIPMHGKCTIRYT